MSSSVERKDHAPRTSPVVMRHRAFRAAFLALAYPGRTFDLPVAAGHGSSRNGNLSPAEAAASLLFRAIWEPDTRVYSCGAAQFLPEYVQQTSASEAEVVVVPGQRSHGSVAAAPRGTEEAPESGAAILYVISESRARTAVRLSGPGIYGSLETDLPIPAVELVDRNVACSAWPLGVDVLIVDDSVQIVGLPRTTRVEVLD